jgi:hypothetical protein
VLAAFTKKALAGDPLTVAGSGDQTRRFVYVEDLADGVVRGLAPEAANRVYNLTGSETTTILEIAEAVQEFVGQAEIVHTPARAGDFGGKEVSSSRALEELGWQPVTPFREGARRYVEWRREREPAPALAAPAEAAPALAATSADPAQPLGGGLRRRIAAAVRLVPRPVRAMATSGIVTAIFFWSFASDDGLSVIAKAFPSTRPVTGVETSAPTIGLIVDAPNSSAPDIATELQQDGASATIALTSSAPTATVDAVHAAGSEVVPRLKPGGPVRWIGTRGQLGKTARGLGIHGHFYYVAPGKGFTLAQDLLGHTAGATPVSGAVKLSAGHTLGKLERGDLVEITVGDGTSWQPWLRSLIEQMRGRGLRAVSAADLVRAEPDER